MKNMRFLGVLWILMMVAGLSGCTHFNYDIDLYSDEEWIAGEGDTYSYVRRTMEITSGDLDLSFSGFYGKHTVWRIDASIDGVLPVDILIQGDLNGLYKICLISPDKEVTVAAQGAGSFYRNLPVSPGRQYITLVGHNASGKVVVRLGTDEILEGINVQEIF